MNARTVLRATLRACALAAPASHAQPGTAPVAPAADNPYPRVDPAKALTARIRPEDREKLPR